MKTRLVLLAAAMMLLPIGLGAQPQDMNGRPEPPKMRAPEEIAQEQADLMKSELNITDKQYKKVYNLIKKDQQYRQEQMNPFGGGMPPQGGGQGGPGMGGDQGFGGFDGGGMPPQGGGQGGPGMGGGMPPQGMGGQRPEGFPGMGSGGNAVSAEYLEKYEANLQKILTNEQYTKWRANHPSEGFELPKPEMMPTN